MMQPVRCKKCDKMLGELTPPYKLKCKRCGEWNESPPPQPNIA